MRKRLNFGVEAPFFGHFATADGLRIDPHKTQAIVEMPPPADVAGVWCLLGMAQYLSKYLPHPSQSGLGAALLQGGQPVAYATKELTPTETRYAQIEKRNSCYCVCLWSL